MEMAWMDADDFASEFPAVASDLVIMLDHKAESPDRPFVLTDEGGHSKEYMSELAIRARLEPRGCTNTEELSTPTSDAVVVVVETADRRLVAYFHKRPAP